MKQSLGMILTTAGVIALSACAAQTPAGEAPMPAAGGAQAPAAGGAAMSVYNGVYTAAQANRGQAVQRQSCAACHSTSDWTAGRILSGWTGQTAFDLISHLRNTMPLNAPGSLSLQQYTDLFAYMLELNNVPAGSGELTAENNALQQVTIEYRR